jgi:hypothetical protein
MPQDALHAMRIDAGVWARTGGVVRFMLLKPRPANRPIPPPGGGHRPALAIHVPELQQSLR